MALVTGRTWEETGQGGRKKTREEVRRKEEERKEGL